ncbi:MAG TPA: alpha/beta hydrolase [Actinomycetota bacterium]
MDSVRSEDGTEIAFERTGEGPPLVMVGGALSDRSAAAPLAALLAPDLTVFAYDRRGRGDSGDTPPYAVEREVEDLEAVIGEAGGSASVLGHSSGAVLSLEAAARGAPVTKLALYEPPFIVDHGRPPTPEDYLARLEDLLAAGERGAAVEYFLRVGPRVPEEALAGMRGSPAWPGLERLAHTLPYDVRILGDGTSGRPLPAGRWASVAVPTLVMVGGDSPPWQRTSARGLAEILPDARYRALAGQTHAFEPAVLAPVLLGFLAG